MVNPLESLKIIASPIGSELDIYWELPAVLPDNYKLYVFKKNGSAPPQTAIEGYFDNINDLPAANQILKDAGVFVFDRILNENQVIADYVVINGTDYYYSAVIRDETTPEISDIITEHAIPDCLLVTDIIDGKDVVAKAIDKMLESIKFKNGERANLKKDIDVVKQFTLVPNKDTIMIERSNAAENQRFFGNQYATYKNMIMLGSVDSDIIRVTFLTPGNAERRDTIANIFRNKKFMLNTWIKEQGVKDCGIVVEGDYYNPMFHGENVIGFTVIFSLLAETITKYEETPITQHITDMEIQ